MVKFAFKAPYTIVVAALMIMVLGVFCLLKLPMDILPAFRLPAVMVVTTYNGMPAEQMEMDITNRLERWLSQASGLDHIESRSMVGVSILNCFFTPGFDPNNALAQISTLVMSDLHYLPPGTLPPIVMVYDPTASVPVAVSAIHTPDLSLARTWDESNYTVRNQLNALPGAVAPVVFGGKLREIMTFLDRRTLAGHGLSPMDVVATLNRGNEMIPTGDAKMGRYDYSISSNGMVPSVAEFDRLPVKVVGGAPVFIGDVGRTRDASAAQTNVVQVNGVEQTFIPIFRRMGANTLSVVAGIKDAVPRITGMIAPNSRIQLLFDQSARIGEAIHDVIRELVVGILLAAITIYFFLGDLKPTFIASLAIPLSIVGCMVGLYFLGQSLNLMTLGGLALVTGRLIDDAVVVLENIERLLEHGREPAVAAEQGADEVALPVLVSTIALMIVFLPVVFFQGLGKYLFIPLALTVCISIALSYFTAMTIVPLAAARFLRPKSQHGHGPKPRAIQIFDRGWDEFRVRYQIMLDWSIANPKVVVAFSTAALLLSLLLTPFLGNEFFPSNDSGMFAVRVRTETGTRIELTSRLVADVSASLKSLLPKDSVEAVLANIGVLPSWAAAYSPNSAPHDALLQIEMNEKSGVGAAEAIKSLRPALAKIYPGTHFSYALLDPVSTALNYGALSPLDLRIVGPDLEKGHALAQDMLAKFQKVPGVVDAFVEQELNYPDLDIHIDRTKAAYLGLTTDDVMKNVITALNSSVLFAPNFWDDPVTGNNYFIGAQYPEADIDSRQTIANIPINPTMHAAESGAKPTLLRNVASLKIKDVPVQISHFAIQRSFDVMANVSGRDIGSIANDIDRIIKKNPLPAGYHALWGGSISAMRSSFGDLGVGMILSLVLIFLLIVAQLKSFVDPLLILATVPMGFFGVIWMLFLTGTTINIQSLMGVIMLIGIIVSNSVILTDFANERMRSGISAEMAMRDAGITRLRPILMTAISTVIALIPSSLSGVNAPLARAVIGGLLAATFFTLNFLPALYVIVKGGQARN
jgi:multidrug efflux pump subunit AcrB